MNTIEQLNKVTLTRGEWAEVLEFADDTAESLAQAARMTIHQDGNDEQVRFLQAREQDARGIYEKISTQVSRQTNEG